MRPTTDPEQFAAFFSILAFGYWWTRAAIEQVSLRFHRKQWHKNLTWDFHRYEISGEDWLIVKCGCGQERTFCTSRMTKTPLPYREGGVPMRGHGI